jgi:Tol biopolymer transport system component
MRFEIPVPEGVVSIDAPRISPDGEYLAFNATDLTGSTRIWLRQMNAVSARPLEGTDGTTRPFWSPDSRFLGFISGGKLKKIDVIGGPPQTICDAPGGSDGTWSPEGVILYDGTGTDPIRRVAAAGGTPVDLIKPDPANKVTQVGWPEFLPDGHHFLYLAIGGRPEDSAYRVGSLDSSETVAAAASQTQVVYAPPGRLLFVRDGTLVSQPFDSKTFKTTGDPVPLAEKIGTDSVGLARFSVSREGTLVYRTGEVNGRLLWVDVNGRELETIGQAGIYGDPAVSRDGTRVVFTQRDPRTNKIDLWVRDLARGVTSRFTFSPGANGAGAWSPDGSQIAFSSEAEPGKSRDIYVKPASGQGEATAVLQDNTVKTVTDWSRDGRYLAYISRELNSANLDIWVLPITGDRKPIPIATTPFEETLAVFSPDGHYLAYRSNESGRPEIYVRTFPGNTGKWQVSVNGAGDPHWSADGKRLYFRGTDQKLMAVDVDTRGSFQAGTPRMLFAASTQVGVTTRNRFDVSPDGRFLTVAPQSRDAIGPTTVVLNWNATGR